MLGNLFDFALVILYFQVEIDIFFCLQFEAPLAYELMMLLVAEGEQIETILAFDAVELRNVQ